MKKYLLLIKSSALFIFSLSFAVTVMAQQNEKAASAVTVPLSLLMLVAGIASAVLMASFYLLYRIKEMRSQLKKHKNKDANQRFGGYMQDLNTAQIDTILELKKEHPANNDTRSGSSPFAGLRAPIFLLAPLLLIASSSFAGEGQPKHLLNEPGNIITLILIMLPLLTGIILMIIKASRAFR
jgi:cytochrome c oxidase cbb3-type subunit 1